MIRISFLLLLCSCCLASCTGRETGSQNQTGIPEGIIIDSLVVLKSERKLVAYSKSEMIKQYDIALGSNPEGKKQIEGDQKTPEGTYFIDAKSAVSKFHKNLNISYPNMADKQYAASQKRQAGGDIKIHGLPNGFDEAKYVRSDWTLGCIALTNTEIDELFDHIKIGSPILILP